MTSIERFINSYNKYIKLCNTESDESVLVIQNGFCEHPLDSVEYFKNCVTFPNSPKWMTFYFEEVMPPLPDGYIPFGNESTVREESYLLACTEKGRVTLQHNAMGKRKDD